MMKKRFTFIMLLAVITLACKKNDDSKPSNSQPAEFSFTSLTATDTVMQVNAVTTLTAIATGEGLSYNWSCDYGTFVGSDSCVQWTVCHSDKFKITCVVKDKNNNSATRDIYVRTTE
jgi:hypothetical protein